MLLLRGSLVQVTHREGCYYHFRKPAICLFQLARSYGYFLVIAQNEVKMSVGSKLTPEHL